MGISNTFIIIPIIQKQPLPYFILPISSLFSAWPLPKSAPQEERHEISSSIIQRNMSFSFSFSFLNNIFPFSSLGLHVSHVALAAISR
jgi:hypothetical protein